MTTILPKGRTQFADANGAPLAGGSVAFYVPGTTTPKDTWQDSGQATLNTNPVALDSAGSATIYGSGAYRQVVKDAAGNTIYDQVTDSPATETSVTSQVAAAATRGIQVFSSSGTFTKGSLPSWVTTVKVKAWGAGGGGGGGNTSTSWRGSGGGGGAYAERTIPVASLAASETVTIGLGGPGGASSASPAAGTNGGGAAFGSWLTATGGTGGNAGASAQVGGVAGGVAVSGDLNINGGDSDAGVSASGSGDVSGGGACARGGPGGRRAVGIAGLFPGGGGSCGNHTASTSGGAGAGALIIVTW